MSNTSSQNFIKNIALLVPAILLYALFFGFGAWVIFYAQDMQSFTPGLLAIWVVLLLIILISAIMITAQYAKWLEKRNQEHKKAQN